MTERRQSVLPVPSDLCPRLVAVTLAIDMDEMMGALASRRDEFARAEPFPHVVIDGLFPAALLRDVAAEYPDADGMQESFAAPHEEGKGQTSSWSRLGPKSAQLIADLNSGDFVEALEELTGIEHLVADTKLEGGGMHRTGRGGHLGIHADFSRHADNGLHRRLNLLLYLNEKWSDEWGGHLELWDRDMQRAVTKVSPLMGRVVVFATTSTSFHGHPDPMACPPDVARKSIALYYYSNDHRDDDLEGRHSTLFQARVGSAADRERVKATDASGRRARLIERWVPPGVKDLAKAAKARMAGG